MFYIWQPFSDQKFSSFFLLTSVLSCKFILLPWRPLMLACSPVNYHVTIIQISNYDIKLHKGGQSYYLMPYENSGPICTQVPKTPSSSSACGLMYDKNHQWVRILCWSHQRTNKMQNSWEISMKFLILQLTSLSQSLYVVTDS